MPFLHLALTETGKEVQFNSLFSGSFWKLSAFEESGLVKVSEVNPTRNFLTTRADGLPPLSRVYARFRTGRLATRIRRRSLAAVALAAIAAIPLTAQGAILYAAAVPGEGAGASAKWNGVTGFKEDSAAVVFEHLTESNGLSNPVVTAFAEDGDGFLWVATQSGVQRWDGYRFWTYKTKLGDPQTLPDNLVNALYADTQGRLWVGTSSGGLARYDRSHDWFIRYKTDASNGGRTNVSSITGDGDRGLWIVADGGLDHLDTESGAFTRAALSAVDGRQPRAGVALRTPDGAIWVGTDLGLEWSAPDDGNGHAPRKFERFPLPIPKGVSTEIDALFSDRSGRVWVGTQNGPLVLESVNAGPNRGLTRVARHVQAKGPIGSLLATKKILSIAETGQGEIWFGTQDKGVLAFKPANGEARQIEHNPAMPDSLSNDWVTTLYSGHGSVMWVGTQRNISYVDTTPKAAFTLFGGTGNDEAFTDTDVYSIATQPDGSIWEGLKDNGINILDASGHKTGELRPEPGIASNDVPLHSLPTGTVPCMAGAADGSVYICTQRALYRADPLPAGSTAAPRITRVPIGDEAGTSLSTLLPDRITGGEAGGTAAQKDVLWIGTRIGLFEIDRDDKAGLARRPHLSQPLTDPRVTVMLRGAGDALWIGTSNGLNRLNVKTGEVETILPDAADPAALGAGLISTLLMDKSGRLWVGTFSGGIDVLEGQDAKGRPRFHRILDDLPNENVDVLLNAPDGSIWASTDGGLARIDPATYNITMLTRAEGSVLEAYWNNVGAVTRAGELLFGGTGGLTVVRPGLAKPWTYEPPVVVTHAHIGGEDVPLSRFNSGESEPPVWVGPASDLMVEFTALDYSAPERNRYEYKLENFDKVWIAADSTRRVARYTNLPPGNYALLLRGSNRDGMWAPVRRIRIHVLPAWYQTWWFDVLAVLVSLLALFGLFLLGTAYLRRQQRELERQVARRTAELHRMTVELQDSQSKLEHMAYRDSLTNLPNRRMFTEHFRQLLAMKMRQGGSFALLLIDFDRFKEINDTYGHDAGDAVLQEMAQRMAANVRASDCFARLGGDEFGLLLAEAPGGDGLETVCQKIMESFQEPIDFNEVQLKTSPSIGVALFPEDGDSQDTLYKAADMALYQAKRQGGNATSLQGMELRLL
jgi:diguanylate cyclase (GGDEF)-like protein